MTTRFREVMSYPGRTVCGMTDFRALDARALQVATAVVDRVDAAALDRPTPCARWSLGQLLAHMTGQNHGFAAAARGETADLTVWADRPVGDDPAGVFAASAADVVAAFAEEGALQRSWWLPEIRDGALFPAQQAMSFHFVDYVVHAWDVAASLGMRVGFDADLLDAALAVAERVPGGAAREREGAAFAPAVGVASEGGTLDRVLALLGRSPSWPAG